jgi:hypothetical protein
MISTSHVSLLSWLQETDYDVWLYLYNNYLIHVINNRKVCKEVHLPNQLQKIIRNCGEGEADEESGFLRRGYEKKLHSGRIYASYLSGRTLNLEPRHEIFKPNHYFLCGLRICPVKKPYYSHESEPDVKVVMDYGITKDELLQVCNGEEYPVDVKRSWNKTKIIKAMLSEYEN